MSKENETAGQVTQIAQAVAAVVKEIPVYQEVVQPAAKEVGNTVGRTVKMCLFPLRALVWGYEQIEEYLTKAIEEKLKNVDPLKIKTPLPQIAGPAIENLRYVAHDEQLREMYATLLANAMNIDATSKTHPGYVEIIKNLSAEDALLLNFYKDEDDFSAIDLIITGGPEGHVSIVNDFCSFDLADGQNTYTSKIIDNLCRLGILRRNEELVTIEEKYYEELEKSSFMLQAIEEERKNGSYASFERKTIEFTDFGLDFKDVIFSYDDNKK